MMKNVYMGEKKFGITYGIQFKRYDRFYFVYLVAYDIREPNRIFESRIPLNNITIADAIIMYHIFLCMSSKNLDESLTR